MNIRYLDNGKAWIHVDYDYRTFKPTSRIKQIGNSKQAIKKLCLKYAKHETPLLKLQLKLSSFSGWDK